MTTTTHSHKPWTNRGGHVSDVERALRVDAAVRQARPDGWRGVQAKENLIKAALLKELGHQDEVERIFAVVFAQNDY
jgi:type I restriction enzyme R subunit